MSRSSNGEFMNFRPKKNVLQPFSNLREKKRSRSELVAARSLLSCKRIRCKAQYENRSFWAEKLGKMKKKCFWPGSPAPGPPDAQGDMGGRSQGEMLNFHTGIEHCKAALSIVYSVQFIRTAYNRAAHEQCTIQVS